MTKADHAGPAPERLHALYASGGSPCCLGICPCRNALPLSGNRPVWIIQDNHPSMTLAVLFFAIHVFLMTTFFVIAGFFAHIEFPSPRRFGTSSRIRLQRHRGPLVIGWPILFARWFPGVFLAAIFRWRSGGHAAPGLAAGAAEIFRRHSAFSTCFAELYAATLVLRTVVAWLEQHGRIRFTSTV